LLLYCTEHREEFGKQIGHPQQHISALHSANHGTYQPPAAVATFLPLVASKWWQPFLKGDAHAPMTNIHKTYQTELIETRIAQVNVGLKRVCGWASSSGSGKTTFLNLAGLLETFEQGSYVLDGEDVSRLGDDARSRYRNQKIGFIFQGFNLIPDLNVFENIDAPLRYRKLSSSERKQRIEQALETVGLASRLKHLPSQLSGGQQQRVAIARRWPVRRALLADEPTGNWTQPLTR
jgi:putative ABC transport system ATP-binding protein